MNNDPHEFLGGSSPRDFLQRYWQRQPLLIRGAVQADFATSLIDGNTLAGLACEEDVDARLVIQDATTGHFSCRYGPFSAADFSALPADRWTLLVQSVDRYLDGIAGLRTLVDFLPPWRLDDVMVSYATKGGGVGPHFDYYDVFLVQAAGQRHWELGPVCNAETPLLEHPDLSLLRSFDAETGHDLSAGDVLYVPPGVAHRGTALTDDCITCSIGFRAPSKAELFREAMEIVCSEFDEGDRYADDVEQVDTGARMGEAIRRSLNDLWRSVPAERWHEALAEAFGKLMTEPREEVPDFPDEQDESIGPDINKAQLSPECRAANLPSQLGNTLFIDGQSWRTSDALAEAISSGRPFETGALNAREHQLVRELLDAGLLRAVR